MISDCMIMRQMKAVSVSRMRALIYRPIDLDDDMSDMNLSLFHIQIKRMGWGISVDFSSFAHLAGLQKALLKLHGWIHQ